jgi:hypothetical protein
LIEVVLDFNGFSFKFFWLEKMEKELETLRIIREKYTKLLVKIGTRRIEENPDENVEDFLDQVLVPRDEVLKVLMKRRQKFGKLKKRQETDESLVKVYDGIQTKVGELQNRFKNGEFCVDCEETGSNQGKSEKKCCCCPKGRKSNVWIVTSKNPIKICLVPKKF